MPPKINNKRRSGNKSRVDNQQAPLAMKNPINEQVSYAKFRAAFKSVISKNMVKKCRTVMLVKDIDFLRLMVHAYQTEEEKVKKKENKNKRTRISSFHFSQ